MYQSYGIPFIIFCVMFTVLRNLLKTNVTDPEGGEQVFDSWPFSEGKE